VQSHRARDAIALSTLFGSHRTQLCEIEPRRNDRSRRRSYASHDRHNCDRNDFRKKRREQIVARVDRRLLNARASTQLTVRTIGGPLYVCASAISQRAPIDDRLSVTQPGRDAHDSSIDTTIGTQEEHRACSLGRCLSVLRNRDCESESADNVRQSCRPSTCGDRPGSTRRRSRRWYTDRHTAGLREGLLLQLEG
jgi:hypothetical protein